MLFLYRVIIVRISFYFSLFLHKCLLKFVVILLYFFIILSGFVFIYISLYSLYIFIAGQFFVILKWIKINKNNQLLFIFRLIFPTISFMVLVIITWYTHQNILLLLLLYIFFIYIYIYIFFFYIFFFFFFFIQQQWSIHLGPPKSTKYSKVYKLEHIQVCFSTNA